MKWIIALALTVVGASAIQAAGSAQQTTTCDHPAHVTAFEDRSWFQPLAANPRNSQMQIFGFGLSSPSEFMAKSGAHKIWDITLGKELPLFVVEKGRDPEAIEKGCWGVGLWLPVDSHFILDFTEDQQPITNNGYHVAIAGKVAYGVSDRDRVAFKAAVEHESDHLSDEAVINAQQYFGDRFRRIDVNYQSMQLGTSWDRVHRFGTITHRVTMLWTLDSWGHPGFYSPGVSGRGRIPPSARNYEPGYGFQYMPIATHGLRPYVSFDARLRTIFNYDKPRADQKENSQFSPSLVIGLRDFGHTNTPDIVFRAYYGVNPNGQYGKQDNYRQFAIGFRLR